MTADEGNDNGNIDHNDDNSDKASFDQAFGTVEYELLIDAISKADGNIENAAKSLNIDKDNLIQKLKKHNIEY